MLNAKRVWRLLTVGTPLLNAAAERAGPIIRVAVGRKLVVDKAR